MTQFWAPTLVRVSGDSSVRGQLTKTANGDLLCNFPKRTVLIANHQVSAKTHETESEVSNAYATDIHRLALHVVDRIHCRDAWPFLYNPQGVTETHTSDWMGNAVFQVHLSQTELGAGQSEPRSTHAKTQCTR